MSRHGMEGGTRSCIRRNIDLQRDGKLFRTELVELGDLPKPQKKTLPKEKKVKIPLPRERVD